MWRKLITTLNFARPKRQAAASCGGAFVVTYPKAGSREIPCEGLSAADLRTLLENHACALHFNGSEDRLRGLLRDLAPEEALTLQRWRVIDGGCDGRVVQVRLTGAREIRRLVRLISTP